MNTRSIDAGNAAGRLVTRAAFFLQLTVYRHGVLWPLALAAVFAAAGLWTVSAVGVAGRLSTTREAISRSQALAGRRTTPLASANPESLRLDQIDALLPADTELESEVRRVYAMAADAGLAVGAAQFATSTEPETGLRRLAITLPINGNYQQVRKFIDTALRAIPNLSLDEIALATVTRTAGAPLDARLRLSLWGRPADGLRRDRGAPALRAGGAR